MSKPQVICLTPVLNEAWILERFLKCASLWADHIIIADQHSTDESREIALQFPKVKLVENSAQKFNEPDRQQMLLMEARRIPGPKILMALDADEIFTANCLTSPEWQTILNSPPGTVIRFQWPEIVSNASGLCSFNFPWDPPIGFVDDGSPHQGNAIHSIRVPMPAGANVLFPNQIKLMHYCLFDRERFKSRIRWYQCWEFLNSGKRPVALYRFYHKDLFVSPNVIQPVPEDWIREYQQRGIDMTSLHRDGCYRWDREILELFDKFGPAKFRRLAIWDAEWERLQKEIRPDSGRPAHADPRSKMDKFVHGWLEQTQPGLAHYTTPGFAHRTGIRLMQRALKCLGW